MTDIPEEGYPDTDEDDFGAEGIELDFGGVDAIQGFVPVPTGAYVLEIVRAKIAKTKDGTGHNVVVNMKIAEGPLEGRSIGQDRWYVPNKKVQTPEKYKMTAGFFKGRLEAVYDAPQPDEITLNIQDLLDRKFKGIVMLVDDGYGPQNNVSAYLPYSADLSNVVIPTPTARPQRASGGNGGAAASTAPTGEGQPGRFRI